MPRREATWLQSNVYQGTQQYNVGTWSQLFGQEVEQGILWHWEQQSKKKEKEKKVGKLTMPRKQSTTVEEGREAK